jgi:hypothetical protein
MWTTQGRCPHNPHAQQATASVTLIVCHTPESALWQLQQVTVSAWATYVRILRAIDNDLDVGDHGATPQERFDFLGYSVLQRHKEWRAA